MDKLNLDKENNIEESNNIEKRVEEEKNELIEKCKKASNIEISEIAAQIESYDEEGKKIIKDEVKRRNERSNKKEKSITKQRSNFGVFLLIVVIINIFQIVAGINFNGLFLAIVIFVIYFFIKKTM